MFRRLTELGVFENGWAPALARRKGGRLLIEYAAYPPWLTTYIGTAPKRGTEFAAWFGTAARSDGALTKDAGDERLEAIPIEITGSLVIYELRLNSNHKEGIRPSV
jgi:hypothetical protein